MTRAPAPSPVAEQESDKDNRILALAEALAKHHNVKTEEIPRKILVRGVRSSERMHCWDTSRPESLASQRDHRVHPGCTMSGHPTGEQSDRGY